MTDNKPIIKSSPKTMISPIVIFDRTDDTELYRTTVEHGECEDIIVIGDKVKSNYAKSEGIELRLLYWETDYP